LHELGEERTRGKKEEEEEEEEESSVAESDSDEEEQDPHLTSLDHPPPAPDNGKAESL
jgi:hypothetical protein